MSQLERRQQQAGGLGRLDKYLAEATPPWTLIPATDVWPSEAWGAWNTVDECGSFNPGSCFEIIDADTTKKLHPFCCTVSLGLRFPLESGPVQVRLLLILCLVGTTHTGTYKRQMVG